MHTYTHTRTSTCTVLPNHHDHCGLFISGYTVKSPPSVPSAVTVPKQTIQKQSAASILSSLTASSSAAPSSQQPHTPSTSAAATKKPTPPPPVATPSSPKLDLGSPKEAEGPPKRVPIPSANKSFQLFKKQALEKSERVSYTYNMALCMVQTCGAYTNVLQVNMWCTCIYKGG